jgi:glucose-1-phosphate adenylyltransferase
MDHVLSVILGGGQGKRLYPLTKYRAKPAVPIGGKYRLIDIPISNCLHSGLNRIYVLTQFNSVSLHRHIYQTYKFDRFSGGYVEILAAQQTEESVEWYQGTADAVRQQMRHFLDAWARQVLILSGDHLYRMDYEGFIRAHRESGAEITIAVKPVTREAAKGLGILQVDARGRIVAFQEKPQAEADLDRLRMPGAGDSDRTHLASMGIYVFEQEVLREVLEGNPKHDFGRDIIPEAIAARRVHAFFFDGYWEDIGTIRSFYETNLALTGTAPPFDLYGDAMLYTHARYLPGSKIDGCTIHRSMVADGCILRDTVLSDSVIGIRSIVGPGAQVIRSVVMGADFYETEAQRVDAVRRGLPDVGIGPGAVVVGAIVDKNARIGEGAVIRNDRGIQEAETEDYVIRDGIVVIPKNAVIPAGTVI